MFLKIKCKNLLVKEFIKIILYKCLVSIRIQDDDSFVYEYDNCRRRKNIEFINLNFLKEITRICDKSIFFLADNNEYLSLLVMVST